MYNCAGFVREPSQRTALVSPEVAQLIQTMMRDLANVEQEIEELKTNQKEIPNRGTAVANQVSGLTIGHACLGRLTPFATSLTSLVCNSIDHLP